MTFFQRHHAAVSTTRFEAEFDALRSKRRRRPKLLHATVSSARFEDGLETEFDVPLCERRRRLGDGASSAAVQAAVQAFDAVVTKS